MASKNNDTIISGKDLGALMMEDFCPRCFWIKQKFKLPWQIFPGIFSSIDSFTKKVVHAYFDIHGKAPAWLPALSGAVKYLKVPHWSKFARRDEATGIIVRGVLDDLFETAAGGHILPDYKTAKYTEGQDKLLPLYVGQLNAYAWVDTGFGSKVESLPLIYCEPVTDLEKWEGAFKEDGFSMGFSAKCVNIEIQPDLIPDLLLRAKQIIDLVEAPDAFDGCKDCEKATEIVLSLFR